MDVTVARGQNIFDVSLQYFGDMSFVSKIIEDNELTWSAPLTIGQVLIINNDGVGNQEVKDFFELSGFIVQNGFISTEEGISTFDSTFVTFDNTFLTFDSTLSSSSPGPSLLFAPGPGGLINLGTVPNDGTGDTLRAGGQKINDTFDEIYTTLPQLDPAELVGKVDKILSVNSSETAFELVSKPSFSLAGDESPSLSADLLANKHSITGVIVIDASTIKIRDVTVPNLTPTGLSWTIKTDGDKETFSDLYLTDNFGDYPYKFQSNSIGFQRKDNEVLTADTAANALTLDATGFSSNLNSAVTTIQLLANAVDALPVGGASLPVDDTTSLVKDPVDATKQVRIDVGEVATATTRVITMPDADVDLGRVVNSKIIIDGMVVDKAVGNTDTGLIEVDDKFFGWISDTRFVAGKATAIPWDTAGNSIFAVDNDIA